MSTLNRLSWTLLAIVGISLVVALALVAGAAVLLGASFSFPAVWAAVAAAIAFKLLTEAGGTSGPPPPPPPPTRPEPEMRLEDLELLHRMWRRGDIDEAAYRQAVAQATRRYRPPPPPVPPRRRRWR
jgi:hypothetical protein